MKPLLSLVGAGPGDPDLITLKAVKALNSAKCVLYDALINEALLDHCPKSTELIYVGKRAGQPHLSQEEINELILKKARIHLHVVRLKGGDPILFGRGHEEWAFALENDLEVEYIAGISSAFSVPGNVSIPVTKRDVSQSVWVLTAVNKSKTLNPDIAAAARSNATVVVLMGLRKIAEIFSLFAIQGKQDIPVAVIEKGTWKDQKIISGTFSEVLKNQQLSQMKGPVIIVIGEVVNQALPQSIVHLNTWQYAS